MSNWCKQHPRYSAKREPNSLCGECWRLWFLRCPEEKANSIIHEGLFSEEGVHPLE